MFSGNITATEGTVGGWNIGTNSLYSGIDENEIKIYSATTYDDKQCTKNRKYKIRSSYHQNI